MPKLILCKTPNIAMSRRLLSGASLKFLKHSISENPTSRWNHNCTRSTQAKTEAAAWYSAGVELSKYERI